jgi:hypothetical protein
MAGVAVRTPADRRNAGALIETQRPIQTPPGALAETGRVVVALYFVVMALGVNTLYLLRHPEAYDGIADLAVLAPYEWLLRAAIRPMATPFTLLLIAFELTVAALMLGRGAAVKLGLAAAILFQLAVIPGVAAYGLVNLPIVAVQLLLLRITFDRSTPELLRRDRGTDGKPERPGARRWRR